MRLDDSVELVDLICFLVWPLPETAMGIKYYVAASWVPQHIAGTHCLVRDTTRQLPLCGVKVLHPAQTI